MKECCKKYLDEQFGDDDVVAEIYGEYVTSLRAQIEAAEAALTAKDWGGLDRAAHTVKGNALAAGDTTTADTAIELRQASKLADEAGSAALLADLREALAEL